MNRKSKTVITTIKAIDFNNAIADAVASTGSTILYSKEPSSSVFLQINSVGLANAQVIRNECDNWNVAYTRPTYNVYGSERIAIIEAEKMSRTENSAAKIAAALNADVLEAMAKGFTDIAVANELNFYVGSNRATPPEILFINRESLSVEDSFTPDDGETFDAFTGRVGKALLAKGNPGQEQFTVADPVAIEWIGRNGVKRGRTFVNRESAAERLAELDRIEAETRESMPTDSGDVRFNYNAEADAIRAAIGGQDPEPVDALHVPAKLTPDDISDLADRLDRAAQNRNFGFRVEVCNGLPLDIQFTDNGSDATIAIYSQADGESPSKFLSRVRNELYYQAGRLESAGRLSVPDRQLSTEETRELVAAVRSHFSASEILAIAFDRYVSSEPTIDFDEETGREYTRPRKMLISLASGKFQAEKDRLVSSRMVQAGRDDVTITIGRILGSINLLNKAAADLAEIQLYNRAKSTMEQRSSSREHAIKTNAENRLIDELAKLAEFDQERVYDVLETLAATATDENPTLREALLDLVRDTFRFGRVYNAIVGCQAIPVSIRIEVREAADRTQPRFANNGEAIGIAVPTNDN